MAELKVGDRVLLLDEDGFLDNADDWNEEVAEALAVTEEVELTPEHWEVINYLRVIMRVNVAPMVRSCSKTPKRPRGKIYTYFPAVRGRVPVKLQVCLNRLVVCRN